MYNLILVDDEVRALSAIRNSVSWEEMNVQVIGCLVLCQDLVQNKMRGSAS